jgi:hypothetical protein
MMFEHSLVSRLRAILSLKQVRRTRGVGMLALVMGLVSLLAGPSLRAPARAQGAFANCRLGAAVINNPITDYAYTPLNLGWYVNYSTVPSPLEPDGIEFVQTVRVHQAKTGWCRDCYVIPYSYTLSPGPTTLGSLALANPGSTWFIGNEPDRRDWSSGGQDEIVPELYAQAYHEASQAIRQADPTAKVGIGGVVQATPLRLKYLDRVWNEYQRLYGRRLGDDVDVWNTHAFVLNERKNDWGAEIPAGLADTIGLLVSPSDNDRLDLFQQQIIRIRTWMRAKGERNKPLYITEFGINMPEYYVSAAQVKAFMSGAIDFLLNYKDGNLGYPMDENRLVQRAIWYSLDDSEDTQRVEDYADSLFSAVTRQRQDYGDSWAAHVQDPAHIEAHQPHASLSLLLSTDPAFVYDPTGTQTFTFTLRAQIANGGNTATLTGDNLQISFWDGPPGQAGSQQLGSTQVLSDVAGCGDYRVVEVPWPDRGPGSNRWYARMESAPDTAEASASALVATLGLYFPIMFELH